MNAKDNTKKTEGASSPKPRVLPPLAFHLQSRYISMAMIVSGEPRILTNRMGHDKTPAIVMLTPEKALVYGIRAALLLPPAPHEGFLWTLSHFFRLNDPTWRITVPMNNVEHQVPVEFLLAYLLKSLKATVERRMRGHCDTAILAIPIWLTSPQRVRLRDAATIAGFSKVHLVNETSAAAHHFTEKVLLLTPIHVGAVLIFAENMSRVDVCSYLCSGKAHHQLQRMLSHFGHYKLNPYIRKRHAFRNRAAASVPETPRSLDVRITCDIVLSLAQKGDRNMVKMKKNLCILDYSRVWNLSLKKVAREKGRRPAGITEEKAVLFGAVMLAQSPNNVRLLDKMAWKVMCRQSLSGQEGKKKTVINRTETLPLTNHTIILTKGDCRVTFFQSVMGREHVIGELEVTGIKYTENAEPCFGITEEGIVDLLSVGLKSNSGFAYRAPAPENTNWTTTRLSEEQVQFLTQLLARLTMD